MANGFCSGFITRNKLTAGLFEIIDTNNSNIAEGRLIILNDKQLKMCSDSKWDFSDLKALFVNCTLKPSLQMSHTEGLIDISKAIMKKNKVSVEVLRPVDYNIAYGVYPDMTEQG